MDQFSPDVILLQEIKKITEEFPCEPFFDKGYNCAAHGQKSYNGVAILSKSPISDMKTKFCDQICTEARYAECITNKVRIASVYVPNGREVGTSQYVQKINFMKSLSGYLEKEVSSDECFIIGGDFNVALNDDDVWDPGLFEGKLVFTGEERASLRRIESLGLTDAFAVCNRHLTDNNALHENFTWWDYRAGSFNKNQGIRLDYLFLSDVAARKLVRSEVIKGFRALPCPSDHAPLLADIGHF
jgi:exodeoxyribonuclease-3